MKFHLAWIRISSLLLVVVLCSCGIRLPVAPLSNPPPKPQADSATHEETEETVSVWLLADEYHTGMAFPYDWLEESGFVAPKHFTKCRYALMSWGNTDAYSQEGISGPANWFRVLFTPTASVMELIPLNRDITEAVPTQRIWKGEFPKSRGRSLAYFLNQCVKTGDDGHPIVIRPSSWGNGAQLEGHHSYFIPRVCNIWSAQSLESLGCKINPWMSMTADGLIREVEKPANGFVQISDGLPPRKNAPAF